MNSRQTIGFGTQRNTRDGFHVSVFTEECLRKYIGFYTCQHWNCTVSRSPATGQVHDHYGLSRVA